MSAEEIYERIPSGIKGFFKKNRAKIATLAASLLSLAVYSALGMDDQADREKERIAIVFGQTVACSLQPDAEVCEGIELLPPDQLNAIINGPTFGSRDLPPPPEMYEPEVIIPPRPSVIEEQPLPSITPPMAAPMMAALPESYGEPEEPLGTDDPDPSEQIAELEALNETLALDLDHAQRTIDGLRSALADANIEKDRAANEAAMSATASVESYYEDSHVCFTNSEWADYRRSLVGLCARDGGS